MALRYDNYLYIKINVIYNRISLIAKKICVLSTYYSLILYPNINVGQNLPEGFQAEVILAANFAQLDEDGINGFDNLGIRTGIDISLSTFVNSGLSTGIHYEQRGSSTGLFSNSTFAESISLSYISFPITYMIYDWWREEKQRHTIKYAVGVLPARLIAVNSTIDTFDDNRENYNNWDFSLHLGVHYAIAKRGNLRLSLQRSLFKIYNDPNSDNTFLRSYWITIGYSHLLNQL